MLEKIVNLLNGFLEKHFIPSLISFVISLIVYLFIPGNSFVAQKLGKFLIIAGVFCLAMIVIEGIYKLYQFVVYKRECNKQEKEISERKNLEAEEYLFEVAHSLSPDDMKLVNYFLYNGNRQLILNGEIYGDRVLTEFCDRNEFVVEDDNVFSMNPFSLEKDIKLEKGMYAVRYRLKDTYYNSFMYLMKKYGKITKFD